MRRDQGVTFIEVCAALLIFSLVLLITFGVVLPALAREEMRGALYTVQVNLQLAKTNAVDRSRACQFRIDTATRGISVYDLNDPSSSGDDLLLQTVTLPSRVTFTTPDASTPVTLTNLSGTTYEARFASNGSVTSSAGVVSIQGGGDSYRVSLFAAGGMKIERWNGSAWVVGA